MKLAICTKTLVPVISLLALLQCTYGAALAAPVYRYVDGEGASHYTDTLDLIPEAYRNQATPVESAVKAQSAGIIAGADALAAEHANLSQEGETLTVTDQAYRPADFPDAQHLNNLDYYTVQGRRNAKIVVFIHGGNWEEGDKSLVRRVDMPDIFLGQGYVFVAANLRLVNNPLSPDASYVEQAADVAAAVCWVYNHAEDIGGNRNQINLVGYSSGAHLVALVGTDGRYLQDCGLKPETLQGVIALDVSAYDIPSAIDEAGQYGYAFAVNNLLRIFSASRATQADASPQHYVQAGRPYPKFLIISSAAMAWRGGVQQQNLSNVQSENFVTALQAVGASAKHLHFPDKTHQQLVGEFGSPGDPVSEGILAFLRQ